MSSLASYDNNGIIISELKKINFFYGANGCGKTTISNLLANSSDPKFNNCVIEWKGDQQKNVLVYNKQFREKNFGTGNIAGVFTLGQATKQDLDNIQDKKIELLKLKEEQITQKKTLETQQNRLKDNADAFTTDCWGIYKQYEEDFKEALRGAIGSKVVFRDKILSEKKSNTAFLLSLDELKGKAATLLAGSPIRKNTIPSLRSYELIDNIEKDVIWKKVIVGKAGVDISGLIEKLRNSDWVNQGRQYLTDDKTCPFCQKETVDQNLRDQIEEYFDESFKFDKSEIDSKKSTYLSQVETLLSSLNSIEELEKINPESKLNVELFSVNLKSLNSQFSENKLLMQEKQEKTSQEIELVDTSFNLSDLSSLINTANSEIIEHNKLVDNYTHELANLKSSIWRYLVEELKDKIASYESKKNGLDRGINGIFEKIDSRKSNIKKLEHEIVVLSKNVTSVQPTVDEINRMLKAYGFTNFLIVSSLDIPNHYAIKRENGDLAHETLSEGEVTFITFLYFVQLAKGGVDQNTVTDDRVVVIDDPISSLDSNVLYVVSTIVKAMIRDVKDDETNSIKQLLLLTHNIYFHKEASFLGSRSNGDCDTNFWILRKSQNVTSIQSYGQNNPIESSYELLWREIKEWKHNSGITLQNTMRRIIENYFKILGKFTDENIVEQFSSFEEQQICRSLISWINDGSHTIPDDLYIQQNDSAEIYLKVFQEIFKLTNNHGHYQMMMGEDPKS